MEEALPECHHQETVRVHRGDADPMKGARNSGLHFPCRRLCHHTGSKAARSFLGPAPGAAGLSPIYVWAMSTLGLPLQEPMAGAAPQRTDLQGDTWSQELAPMCLRG